MNETAKQEILYFLKGFASKDENFASKFDEKYIDKCCEYIVSQAKIELKGTSGCIDSDTVFQWARHYYLEGLFEKEKMAIEEARLKRIQEDDAQEKARKQRLAEIRAEKIKEEGQMSLFDLGV